VTDQPTSPTSRRVKFAAFVVLVATALLVGGYITADLWGGTVRAVSAPILETPR
jgi:hypothetical protein